MLHGVLMSGMGTHCHCMRRIRRVEASQAPLNNAREKKLNALSSWVCTNNGEVLLGVCVQRVCKGVGVFFSIRGEGGKGSLEAAEEEEAFLFSAFLVCEREEGR